MTLTLDLLGVRGGAAGRRWRLGTAPHVRSTGLIMLLAVFGFSVPVFVVGYLLAYRVRARSWAWLPVQGYTPIGDGLWPVVQRT